MKLYSFDVFDTLITRKTAQPKGIFAVMQQALSDTAYDDLDLYVKSNFYSLRVGAEQVARRTYSRDGREEITLEQIYGILVREHHLNGEQAERLGKLERETELTYVTGIEENIKKVKRLLKDKKRVILISDMYLDSETIRKMLVKADDVFENIPLYVSSDKEKKSKWSGNLYRLVKEKENIEYSDWIHFGDNEHSDYNVPKWLGINREKYIPEELLDIEKSYLQNQEFDARIQLAIGCARVARYRNRQNQVYRLGCGIGGIVIFSYANWILQDCVKKGIKRLYFIARDGFVVKEVVDVLIKKLHYPIETKYIYGSRMAWRIPDEMHLKEDLREIYKHSYISKIFCAEDLAEYFQVTMDELFQYLPEKLMDKSIEWAHVDYIIEQLLMREDFVELLRLKYREKHTLLVQYLQQEIDTTNEKFAFVDVSGSGFTQECLAKVMRTYYSGEIKNYFYRKDVSCSKVCKDSVFYPFFVDYYLILEMFCRAPHGQTIGYCKDDSGKIVPVYADVDGNLIKEHGVLDFIDGIRQFSSIYEDIVFQNEVLMVGNEMLRKYLEYVVKTPDVLVSDFFGDMPDMQTGREKMPVLYAPKLTKRDIKNIYLYGKKDKLISYYKGANYSYSLLRCTENQKKLIQRYERISESRFGSLIQKVHRIGSISKKEKRILSKYDFVKEHIIIYGAGKKGEIFNRQITGKEKVNGVRYHSSVVLWVDSNYKKYRHSKQVISAPEEISKVTYDQIVIAVLKRDIAMEIKEQLLEMGVDEKCIFWLYEIS